MKPQSIIPRAGSLLALALLLAFALPVGAGTIPPDLDAYIEKGMKEWKIPGMAIAVVKDGKVVLCRGYGVRQEGRPEKVDDSTIFAIGSTSKAFTAAAVGSLVDAGKLQWDSKVIDLWPDFKLSDPWVTHQIRVSDLLANHSGLSATSEALWYGTTYSREDILRRLAFVPFDDKDLGFRYQFQYRNVAFLAAGQLIPRVDGRTWDKYLADVLFGPLGMSRTFPTANGVGTMTDVSSPHVSAYDQKPMVVPYRNMDNIAPAGAIVSCAKDMAQWVGLNLSGGTWNGHAILKPATVEYIHAGHTNLFNLPPLPPVQLPSYCLGWLTESYQGKVDVWHNGDIDGMSTWVGLIPQDHLGVVVLCNLGDCDFRRAIYYKIVDSFEGNPPSDLDPALFTNHEKMLATKLADNVLYDQLKAKPIVPELPLASYTGTYHNAALGDVSITLENGTLVYQQTPIQVIDLICKEKNNFLGKYHSTGEDLRNGKVPVDFTVKAGAITSFTDTGMFTYQKVPAQ